MPDVFLLSHATGNFEVTTELQESQILEALSGKIKIVDIENLNFLNTEGEWEEIQGKAEVFEEEEILSFKLGARRCVDFDLLWTVCKRTR